MERSRADTARGLSHRRKWRRALRLTVISGLLLPGICVILPVIILISGSLTEEIEWQQRLVPLLVDAKGSISWKWIPDYPVLENFKRLLFYQPQFLMLFWNSIGMTGAILLGQLLVGIPSAWSFAVYRFRGRQLLFTVYILLMLLPFQVTMLSKYLVLKELGLLNTRLAVILPAIFSTFPVFLLYRSFCGIPQELLEAARMDGAGEGRIFIRVGLPLGQGGIMAAFIISFLEAFNMMEEPLAFLENQALWPLSLYLPEIGWNQAGTACVASLLTMTVSVLVFAAFRDSLEQGIVASGLKA